MPCNAGYDWCKDKEVVHKKGNKEYCVFHAPKENKGISVGEFNQLVFDEINKAIADNSACDLRGTVFPGDIDFSGVNRGRKLPEISFKVALFAGKAYFFGARFTGKADFMVAEFTGGAYFLGAQFTGEAVFKWLTIGGKIKFHNVNLDRASFMGTDLRLCDFITCTWLEKGGRYILFDETEYKDKYKEKGFFKRLWKHFTKLTKERENAVKDVENLYRTLKQKSREKFDEYQYSFWHMSEKEMQWERTTPGSSPRDWLVLFLYKYSSGYGEEPGRAFLWLGILIALSFFLIPIASVGISHGWDSARITIDYLTFRKPDEFVPKGFIGFLVSFISHIVIPIQAALFAFALRNRFRR